jgi:HAMP domain-containing protein
MSLRSRLLLGYAVLVLLLVLAAGGGAIGFRAVAVEARGGLEPEVVAADRAERLLLSLDDHHLAAVDAVLSPGDPALRTAVEDHAGSVRVALAEIEREASEEAVEGLKRPVETYLLVSADALVAGIGGGPAAGTDPYLRAVKEADRAARAAAARHFSQSQQRLEDSSQRVAAIARRYAVLLGALATVGLVALVFLAHGLHRHVLERLAALHAFSMAIDAGQDGERVSIERSDELSRVAAGMNRMLDRREALEHSMRGRLAQQRDTLLGLLASVHDGAILLTPSGALVASLDPTIAATGFESLSQTARDLRASKEESGVWRDSNGNPHSMTRLASGDRDVGWLVVPRSAKPHGLVASAE